jgi:hypothetical protein
MTDIEAMILANRSVIVYATGASHPCNKDIAWAAKSVLFPNISTLASTPAEALSRFLNACQQPNGVSKCLSKS